MKSAGYPIKATSAALFCLLVTSPSLSYAEPAIKALPDSHNNEITLNLPSPRIARSGIKAPPGSRNNEIKLFAVCLGQATARVPKLTDALNKAKGDSSVYLAEKGVAVFNQMRWMYNASVATINSVENPDPKIFEASKALGEKKGRALFAIEEKCLSTCTNTSERNELHSCIEDCEEQLNPNLHAVSRGCDTVQAQFQAQFDAARSHGGH